MLLPVGHMVLRSRSPEIPQHIFHPKKLSCWIFFPTTHELDGVRNLEKRLDTGHWQERTLEFLTQELDGLEKLT